jgi:hypothetical protein
LFKFKFYFVQVEFHTELELLPASALLNNPYIAKSVKLEQFIMEGSYNKVKSYVACSRLF